jgi:hypothetical protein
MSEVHKLNTTTAIPEAVIDPIAQAYLALSPDDRKAIDALERFIKDEPENSRIFTITPGMADYILKKYNLDNRPIKPMAINIYSDAMGAGEWVLTGDTLKFSNLKRLRDGQNRLMACIKSGTAFRTHIVFGIGDEYFSRMDQGKNRGGADLLAIEGIANASDVSAAVRWAELIQRKTVKQRTTFTPPTILNMYKDRHSGVSDFITSARRIRSVSQQPVGMVAAMLYHFDQVDTADTIDFAAAWENGKWTGRYKPLQLLQNRVKELETATHGRVHDVVRAALIVIAWNMFRRKQKPVGKAAFEWTMSDPFPVIG